MNTPSDGLFFAAITATKADLDRYTLSKAEEDRQAFLDAAAELVQLSCEWVAPYVAAGDPPPRIPDDVRTTYVQVLAVRNHLLGHVVPTEVK